MRFMSVEITARGFLRNKNKKIMPFYEMFNKKNVLLVFRVFLPGLRQKPDEKVDVRPIDVVLGW